MDSERKVTINVVVNDGEREWVEESTGISGRHALRVARDKYRDRARVDPEDPADG
jgi:hypothetical protein